MIRHLSVSRAALAVAFAAAAMVLGGCHRSADAAKPKPHPIATIETDQGTIEIELLPEIAPKAVENFRLLAQRGYYDGLTFHRIVKGFMIQGGDPLGNGRGGESAWGGTFDDEIDKHSAYYRDGYKRGSVAMANSGPNTNTSQFFIVQQDYPLAANYTIFGRVTKGMEVVDAICALPLTLSPEGEQSRPVTPPVMKKVIVSEGATTAPSQPVAK